MVDVVGGGRDPEEAAAIQVRVKDDGAKLIGDSSIPHRGLPRAGGSRDWTDDGPACSEPPEVPAELRLSQLVIGEADLLGGQGAVWRGHRQEAALAKVLESSIGDVFWLGEGRAAPALIRHKGQLLVALYRLRDAFQDSRDCACGCHRSPYAAYSSQDTTPIVASEVPLTVVAEIIIPTPGGMMTVPSKS